jgi:hypothetical protein
MSQGLTPYPSAAHIAMAPNKEGILVPLRLSPMFDSWFQSLGRVTQPLGNNGATAQRPVGSAQQPLYVGQDFFDTTLGYKVTIKSLNPTVWVNGAGAAV